MKTARILLVAMLVGLLGLSPSHAETTTVAEGTVTLGKSSGIPDHEMAQYYQEGCQGSHTSAVFTAFVDVRNYRGASLRFTPTSSDYGAGAPPTWHVITGTSCEVRVLGSDTSGTSSITVTIPDNALFLAMTFFTSAVVNAHYKLETA